MGQAPYLRRGLLWPQTIYLPAPTGGWNPDANMWELGNTQAPILDNWLIRQGKLVARGPFVNVANITTSSFFGGAVLLDGLMGSASPSGALLLQFIGNSLTQYVLPWLAPLTNAQSANLAAFTGNLQRVLIDTGTVASAAVTADTAIGPRWVNFNGLMYGISIDAVAAAVHDTNSNYFIKPLNLLTLPAAVNPVLLNSTGSATPTFVDSGGGGGPSAWSTPNNAQTVNGVVTSSSLTGSTANTNGLTSSAHAFAIPVGATVTGIQVDITRGASQNDANNNVQDVQIEMVKAGVIQSGTAQNRAIVPLQWSTSLTSQRYGGKFDLWNNTWSPADINSGTFGVFVRAKISSLTAVTANIDAVIITVYYTNDTITVPTVLANAPHGAFDLKGYLSRVWLLGGVDTPGALTVHEPTTLFYTNPIGTPGAGSPLGTNSTDWKDPVTGVTNKLTMDANNSDFGVGLAQVANALLIFRHNSVWRLTGTTSSTFVLKLISREVGCVDARSIVETDRGVFWVSQRGLMFTDGNVVKNVSGPVQNDLVASINAIFLLLRQGPNMPFVTCGLTSQGQIIITTGYTVSGSSPSTKWSGMYDPTTGAWNRLTSALWFPGDDDRVPFWLVGRPGRQQLYSIGDATSSQHVVQLENYGYNDGSRWGLTFLSALPGQNGNFDIDKADVSQTQYPDGNMHAIPYRWVTKLFPMGPEHRQGKVKRFYLDHTNAQFGFATITNGWTLQPFSSNDTIFSGNALEASARQLLIKHNVGGRTVVGGGTQRYATPPYVSRYSGRADWEFNDIYFDLQSNVVTDGNSTGDYLGEIFGLGVEYLPTREYEGNEGVGTPGGSGS